MSDTHSPESAPSAPTPEAPSPVDKDAAKEAIRQAQESGDSIDKLPRQQSPSELASLADAIDALPERIAQAWAEMYPQPPKQEKAPKQKDKGGETPPPKKEEAKPQKRTFAQMWFGE